MDRIKKMLLMHTVGWRAENLINSSELLSDTVNWTRAGVAPLTLDVFPDLSPAYTMFAQASVTPLTRLLYQNSAPVSGLSGIHTASAYVSIGTLTQFSISFNDSGTTREAIFDIIGKSLISSTNILKTFIVDEGSGIVRVGVTVDLTGLSNLQLRLAKGGSSSFIASATDNILINKIQLEVGDIMNPYNSNH